MEFAQFAYPIQFSAKDLEQLTIEDLALRMRVSRAFIRLCVSSGCPTRDEKLSAAALLVWLFDHYEQVRTAGHLKALASVDGLSTDITVRLRMANALITLFDFSRSRATSWQQKRGLRIAGLDVNRLVDSSP